MGYGQTDGQTELVIRSHHKGDRMPFQSCPRQGKRSKIPEEEEAPEGGPRAAGVTETIARLCSLQAGHTHLLVALFLVQTLLLYSESLDCPKETLGNSGRTGREHRLESESPGVETLLCLFLLK